MLPGPIFRVELVSVARRRRYFLLRTLYATLILLVLWTTYSTSRYVFHSGGPQSIRHSATLAASFFMSFTWLQMLAILFVGPAMAAGTIATERERRTIEYLFATDLSNAEIVLGKTLARLTLLGQFVLVGLPILFLFRLLGGIPAQALLATFLSAAGTALMLTGISIAISVCTPKARDAVGRTYLALIALFALPGILYGLAELDLFGDTFRDLIVKPLAGFLMLLNPLVAIVQAVGSASAIGFGLNMDSILKAVGSQCLVAAACLAFSTFAVRRVHLTETTRTAQKQKRLRFRQRRPVGEHAMLWKEMFSSTSAGKLGRIGWIASIILFGAICGMTIWMLTEAAGSVDEWRRNNYFQYLVALTGYLGCGMLLLLASRGAGLMSQEKERDTWVTLLSTPLTGKEIVFGKLCGNLYHARGMLAVLVVSWLLGMLLTPTAFWPAIATGLLFCLMAVYATCLGLLFSLKSQTTLRAMGQTLGTLVFFGGGYLFCCCTVMIGGGGGGDDLAIILALCIPFLLVFPGIVYLDPQEFLLDNEAMTIAFGVGMLIHIMAAAVLYAHVVTNFDRYAGRTVLADSRLDRGPLRELNQVALSNQFRERDCATDDAPVAAEDAAKMDDD